MKVVASIFVDSLGSRKKTEEDRFESPTEVDFLSIDWTLLSTFVFLFLLPTSGFAGLLEEGGGFSLVLCQRMVSNPFMLFSSTDKINCVTRLIPPLTPYMLGYTQYSASANFEYLTHFSASSLKVIISTSRGFSLGIQSA